MKQLVSQSIAAPGFFGLNTQESSITLASGYALQADNCVIDAEGRLGARKGYIYNTSSGGNSSSLVGMHDFVGSTGHLGYITWGNGKIYRGLGTLTAISTGHGSANDWQAASLGGAVYLAQAGKPMLKVASNFSVSTHATTSSNHQFSFVTSAYGRLWAGGTATDKYTLYGSNLVDGSFASGSTLSLDLRQIWTNGGDEIVSVAGFNGRVIVFCKRCIVILGDDNNADLTIEPAKLSVVEVLENVGCVSRKSIQAVGNDIYFLANSGLRSLTRVIQEKSNPLADLSINIRDDLVKIINLSTTSPENVTAIYSASNAFYLLLFPSSKLIYCFDTRGRLDNGGLRVTKWVDTEILSGLSAFDGTLFLGLVNGIARYTGFQDGGAQYYLAYRTNHFDFDQPTVNKIIKIVGVTVIGGSGQNFSVKVGTDYSDQPRSYNRTIKQSAVSEYDVAQYNISEYTGGGLTDRIKVPVGGQGSVIQLGFEAYINGDQLSIQKFDVYVKQGRTN